MQPLGPVQARLNSTLSPNRPMWDFPFLQTWQAQFEYIREVLGFWLDYMFCIKKKRYFDDMLILNRKYIY